MFADGAEQLEFLLEEGPGGEARRIPGGKPEGSLGGGWEGLGEARRVLGEKPEGSLGGGWEGPWVEARRSWGGGQVGPWEEARRPGGGQEGLVPPFSLLLR